MQRCKFKSKIVPQNLVHYDKTEYKPRVNNFSDCIRDSVCSSSRKKVIHTLNKKVAAMKNLI